MGRVSRALPHLSAETLKQKFKTAKNFWQQQKWLVIYNALVDPRPANEIAKHTGVSVSTVHQVISEYNRYGQTAIETPGLDEGSSKAEVNDLFSPFTAYLLVRKLVLVPAASVFATQPAVGAGGENPPATRLDRSQKRY